MSVVGTIQDSWSIADPANDYAKCAAWASDSGANCIEANLSCPNVATCDGQLYQIPEYAGVVVRYVREVAGNIPLLVKIGHLTSSAEASSLLDAVVPGIDGLVMTNSVATAVTTREGFAFDGQRRGICGQAILQASLNQVGMFSDLLHDRGNELTIVGCDGATTTKDVKRYLQNGAAAVHIATAAMIDPRVAIRTKQAQFMTTRSWY